MQEEVPLATPDVLVCSVGTEIFFESSSESQPMPDAKWSQLLDQGWNRQAIAETAVSFNGVTLQVNAADLENAQHDCWHTACSMQTSSACLPGNEEQMNIKPLHRICDA